MTTTTTIRTRSGSQYRLVRGDYGATVTRLSETPIVGYDHQLVCEPLEGFQYPRVGQPWRYRTEAGPFVTTTVVDVSTTVDGVVLDNLDVTVEV